MITVLILVISVLANILLGLFVFQRNPRSITSKFFSLLTLSLASWAIVSYLSVADTYIDQLFLVRLTMFFVILMNSAFFFLAQVFPSETFKFRKIHIAFAIFCLLSLVVSLSPALFTELKISESGVQSPVPGPGILLFIIHVLISVIGAPVVLSRRYLRSKGIAKHQYKFFLLGALLMFTLLPLTNFILPIVFNFPDLILISPLYTVCFSSLITYAIIKHRLFDLRLAAARATVYVLSLGVLVLIYAFTVFFLLQKVLTTDSISQGWQQAIYISLLLVTALIFQRVKTFFDRVTNKIFYKDAYDPQEFLDQLNKSILSNIEIGILLRRTTGVIKDNLKCSYCYVVLHETHNGPMRAIGTEKPEFSQFELDDLQESLGAMDGRVIFAGDIPDPMRSLKKMYTKHNIDFIVHLKTNSYGSAQTVAYLIFGPKNSGNVYSDQDLRIIDIVSGELIIAIQNALRFEEIQEFNVTLQKNVNDATGKLKRTNEKLKVLDETKDEFISMASHQLRTPLTSVKGYLSMVLEGDVGEINDNQRKLLDQAFVSSQRMVYLIADLLNVSRLRTGKFIINTHPTNLAEVVESEISSLREQARSKGLDLDYEKPDDFPVLMIDETKIRQVIMNFVDNAIFYTPSGGRITIKLTTDKTHVYFIVKDNGIGVPKEDQKHMFTKFYRGRNARASRPDGTGLGLFMAKKVIEAQGGNILFESTEGKGSAFGFSFNKKHLANQSESADNDTNQQQE